METVVDTTSDIPDGASPKFGILLASIIAMVAAADFLTLAR